jgi:hypothetical protein
MISDWDTLSDELQLALSRAALSRAAVELADHADAMAQEMEAGQITDRGGPDALRLFGAILRITGTVDFATVGNA